jgi:hypothetical protein
MTFYCLRVDDYADDPTSDWWEADSWCNDPDDAARNYMEEIGDSYGIFGRDENAEVRRIFVFDTDEDKTYIVEVRPNPQPAYSNIIVPDSEADETIEDYYTIPNWTGVPKPATF